MSESKPFKSVPEENAPRLRRRSGRKWGNGVVKIRLGDGKLLEIHIPNVRQCGGGSSDSPEPHFSIRRGNFVLKRGALLADFLSGPGHLYI